MLLLEYLFHLTRLYCGAIINGAGQALLFLTKLYYNYLQDQYNKNEINIQPNYVKTQVHERKHNTARNH